LLVILAVMPKEKQGLPPLPPGTCADGAERLNSHSRWPVVKLSVTTGLDEDAR